MRKPRRLSFGVDGEPPMDGGPFASYAQHAQQTQHVQLPQHTQQAAAGLRRLPSDGSQRSGASESMVELESLSGVPDDLVGLPEDLLRQSLSGAIPVSIRALQVDARSH